MFSQTHYLLRSKTDGRYLVARIQPEEGQGINYILVFKEHHEALSYLNTHAAEFADQFGVESVISSQLTAIMQRWGYKGIGIVEEPIEPRVKFLQQQKF